MKKNEHHMEIIKNDRQIELIRTALHKGKEALRHAVDERTEQQQEKMHSFAFRF